jgi:glycosyltransferase involved in cell wall biosynthesis
MRIHYEADLGDGDPGHPMSLRAKVRQRLDAFWRDVAVGHERRDARACARILVNSLFSRESFARAYGLDSHVCYLGINTDLFQPTHATREPFVMGLSTISLHKDLQIAVRALATIPAPNRPALKWAGHIGDRRYQQETETLARELGVDLELLPSIDDASLIDHLNRATAMLFTSKLEPFGFAPLEANACGTPVVAIGEGGVRETVTDGVNGLVIANRDPIALGSAIQKLIEQPDLAERLGQNGLELVRSQWTWNKAVNDLENHLRDVVKQAR